MKLNTTVAPFILRGVHLLGTDSANCPMALRQTLWNKLAVAWRPDRVHDQVRTIDFEDLPTHFDAYLKGMVRGRTVVRVGRDTHPSDGVRAAIGGRRKRPTRRVGRDAPYPDRADPAEPPAFEVHMRQYRDFHRRSLDDRDAFWRAEAALVDWHTPFTQVLDYSRPPFARWFVGGRTNLCHNAVDRHLKDRAAQTALVYLSTETGDEQHLHLRRALSPRSTGWRRCCSRSASGTATAC